jgi:hypothetical protein
MTAPFPLNLSSNRSAAARPGRFEFAITIRNDGNEMMEILLQLEECL